MKLNDKQFKRNGAMVLSFRKNVSHEADKVAELAEENCDETLILKFQDVLASSVKDLAAITVAKELEVDQVECGVHQGGKAGSSAVG